MQRLPSNYRMRRSLAGRPTIALDGIKGHMLSRHSVPQLWPTGPVITASWRSASGRKFAEVHNELGALAAGYESLHRSLTTRRHSPPCSRRSTARTPFQLALAQENPETVHPTAEAHVQASVPSSRSWSNRLEWSADRCCEATRVVAGYRLRWDLLDCADHGKCAYVTSHAGKREHRELAQRLEIRAPHVTIVRSGSDETKPVTWRR